MAAGSKNTGKNRQLVKCAHQTFDDMKYEIARELSLPVHQGSEDYWGAVASSGLSLMLRLQGVLFCVFIL